MHYKKDRVALKPPLGWNSWDCYGPAVNEVQLLGNARYMAEHLKAHGWQYVVCDIQWYEPEAGQRHWEYNRFVELCMDGFGRLIPAENRFPSAANGAGFKPIADQIHALGLKFGIHIMRGVPRLAVHRALPVKGTNVTCRDIAHANSICAWNTDMYGVDADRDGAQAYYDAIFELYASWGVDYVKVDDICNVKITPLEPYSARREIEMIRRAIDRCGRDMVLSLSPGPAVLEEAWHLAKNANMWRITDDFWDNWDRLHNMFDRCLAWQDYVQTGAYPDCDMLPIGRLAVAGGRGNTERYTRFTHDEQITMMTLWSIFRSPLMIGAEMRRNDEFTLSLLTNSELIDMLKNSHSARQLRRDETQGRGEIIWAAKGEECKYIALFNTDEAEREISFDITDIAVGGREYKARDLWAHEEYPLDGGELKAKVNAHGARLFKIM